MGLLRTFRTWQAGETVTAAMLNAEVRDFGAGLQAASDTYPGTLANWSVGNGTLITRYYQVGKHVTVEIDFTAKSTSTFGGNATFSLPAAPRNVAAKMPLDGNAWLYDASADKAYYFVPCLTAQGALQVRSATDAALSDTQPFIWTGNDRLYVIASYEAA